MRIHIRDFKKIIGNKKITFVDVLFVITVIGILAVTFHPGYHSWVNKTAFHSAVTNLQSDLEMAKHRAIQENVGVTVVFAPDAYDIFLDNGAGGGIAKNWIRDGKEIQLKKRKIPSAVNMNNDFPVTAPGSSTKCLRFDGYGRPSRGGTVRLTGLNNIERELTVHPAGRIKMEHKKTG